MKFFNITGPCNPKIHYMLPSAMRLDERVVKRLIAQQSYFVLHAPRQTGKTTAMLELARQLTASGDYISVMVSMEVGAAFPHDIGQAEDAILNSWRQNIRFQLPKTLHPSDWKPDAPNGQGISEFLAEWSLEASLPLVVLLDEIDALQNEVLLSVLRQLRDGFPRRPTAFPNSVALIGLRDVRDYKIRAGGSPRLNTNSPFNIAARSFALRNFTEEEVYALLRQHTDETGQAFTNDALAQVFHLSQGQPWLVNALAKVSVEELVLDETMPVEVAHINQSREILIQRRQTHLDQLTDKLLDERVRRVIEPILAGGTLSNVPLDDRDYVVDLGLVRRINGSSMAIANPIYGEVIPRVLASSAQDSLPTVQPTWLNADGSLNTAQLLDSFLAFWRQHGQPLLQSAPYHEIAPHLVMMTYLHRVVNGEGLIEREYAIGMGRIDLCLFYRDVRVGMELKVWRDGQADPLNAGLTQLDVYLSGLGLERGWLVIFDQRSDLPKISERTTTEMATSPAGRSITVIRG
ncbi:MAG: AAA-like domain-containing protein [Chloroflexota bacterium]